jgi:hypothetical protein
MSMASYFSRLARDPALALAPAAALALLGETGQPERAAVLELEHAIGGAQLGGVTVGLASVRVPSPNRGEWRSLAWYAKRDFVQVGCDFGPRATGGGTRLPALFFMDESGWIHEDVALDLAVPIAESWQTWVRRLVDEGPDVIRGTRHTSVIALSGATAADLAAQLALPYGEIPRGEHPVVWDAAVADAWARLVDEPAIPRPFAVVSALARAELTEIATAAQPLGAVLSPLR